MKKLLPIFFGLALLSAASDDIMSPEATDAKLKTVYIYNFTKYIDWPEKYKSGNFTIAILGSNSYLLSELQKMQTVKKAGTQNFEIRSLSSLDNSSQFHMLFVSPDYQTSLSDISSKLKGKSTLLITDKPGMAKQGAAINFVIQSSKQKFELSKSNAEKYKLKVSSSLAQLAILVD